MAEKNVTVSDLSAAALDDSSTVNPAETGELSTIRISPVYPLYRFNSDSNCSCHVPLAEYPDTQTDQLHALSIADMIKQGQGSVSEFDDSNYDLKPNQKAIASDFGESLQNTEWADPAQIFESSQKLNEEFTKSIVTIDHDKLNTSAEKTSADKASAGKDLDTSE